MGILRQKGHSEKSIFAIYEVNINAILSRIGLVVELFTLVIGLIFIDMNYFSYVLVTMAAIFLLIVVINRVIVLHTLKNM